MRYAIALCVVLVAGATAMAATNVTHVAGNISNWRGGWNSSPSHAWLCDWPNADADGSFAEFSRTTLQNAINAQIAATGAWNAKIIVTQVEWIHTAIPANFAPVVVSVDVDPTTLKWGSSYAYNAGNGSWSVGGSSYANFVAAVNAGVAAGKSWIADNLPWADVWKPVGVEPISGLDFRRAEIDVPEWLLVQYLSNPDAEGLFVGAAVPETNAVDIYGTDQWGGIGDVHIVIDAQPTTAPWMITNVQTVEETISLTAPTRTIPITVNNAGSDTLAWTASESPAVDWLSLATPTGGNGGSFDILLDMTGKTPGTYKTNIQIADPNAANKLLMVPVTVSLFASQQPTIELDPASLSFVVRPTDPAPSPATVTVHNIAFGSLTWTAAIRSPAPSWLSMVGGSGTDDGSFYLVFNHAGLDPDEYTAYVDVTDPNASNSPQTLKVTLSVREQDADATKANSYDDAWENPGAGTEGWVIKARTLKKYWALGGKTDGFVVHIGDSITYANPFGQWARYGAGKTAADTAVCNWMHAGAAGDGTNNTNNGWYLAYYDRPGGRSFTAESGIRADQYLAGSTDMPSCDEMFTLGFTNPDGKQYRDAQIVVVMLGTNDASSNRTKAAVKANLETIVDKIEATGAIVVLSTIPPKRNDMADVGNINDAIREICQARQLPMIDFFAECMRRRPGSTWDNTLISGDGIHPSASGGGYGSASVDPYQNSAAPLSSVGYLLRCWLSVQKIAEIKAKVIDAPAQLTGDADWDGEVSVLDIVNVVNRFGAVPGDPAWSPSCDFDLDREISVLDIVATVTNFGATAP